MRKRNKKFIATVVVAALAVAAVPAVVVASVITNATAVAVNVTASLRSNTQTTFTGSTGPLAGLTTTCTASATKFQLNTKGGGLGPFTITPPTFGTATAKCTDNLGGTDTITSNSTNGPWTSTYVNGTSSTNPDMLKIGIPKAGQKLVSTFAPSCTVTVDPTAAGSVSGTYDNAGNFRITNAVINYSAAGTCPTGTGSGTAKFSTVLKSGSSGTPGFVVSPVIFGVH